MTIEESRKQVDSIALGDLIRRLSLILKGQIQTDGTSGKISIYNENLNKRVSVSLIPGEQEGIFNILLEGGINNGTDRQFKIARLDVEHLYITWDTPEQISLCYTQDSRYSVINICNDATIVCIEGKDRRQNENNNSDEQKKKNGRRKFYHIGSINRKSIPNEIQN